MCTVTWTYASNIYELFFNRDEKNDRLPARPLRIDTADGVRFISARDGDAGGTWLTVNEYGLTIGLLNYYSSTAKAPESATGSRGQLVLHMAGTKTVAELEQHLAGVDLGLYRPFIVLALSPLHRAWAVCWDGEKPDTVSPLRLPLSSSSYDTNAVLRERRAAFERMRAHYGEPTATWLPEYHRSHKPTKGAYSVCMHRSDAHTVSYSHITVAEDRVSFAYSPAPPCNDIPQRVLELPRRRSTPA